MYARNRYERNESRILSLTSGPDDPCDFNYAVRAATKVLIACKHCIFENVTKNVNSTLEMHATDSFILTSRPVFEKI